MNKNVYRLLNFLWLSEIFVPLPPVIPLNLFRGLRRHPGQLASEEELASYEQKVRELLDTIRKQEYVPPVEPFDEKEATKEEKMPEQEAVAA